MAIDRVLPHFDVREYHSTTVRASPERAYAAIRTFDLTKSWLSMLLFSIRRARRARVSRLRLDDIVGGYFEPIAEDPGREIVLGTAGRFWRVFGGGVHVGASEFATYADPGTAKAAMSFRVDPLPDGRTRVSTETRVLCADAAARRIFRVYWALIAIGSAVIRLEMLRLIKREAERV